MRHAPSSPVPAFFVAIALATLAGCSSFATPHQMYAPLLDHRGQLDLLVRGNLGLGGTGAGGGGNAGIAWAPIENFELVAGGDLYFGSHGIRRFAGQLGAGVFARDDVLRLEAIAGVFGGSARGLAESDLGDELVRYRLEGPYAAPYAQVFAGYEWRRIEMAWGVRVLGFVSEVHVRPLDGAPPLGTSDRYGYEQVRIEPSYNARAVLHPMVRLDFVLTGSILVAGDEFPGDGAPDVPGDTIAPDNWFSVTFGVGVGIQLDTADPPGRPEPPLDETLDEPSAPQGAYVPPR